MAASETMQARQAALLLHGLPPAARRQVIAKLDAHETTRLEPLLDELAGLGVSPAVGLELQAVASQPAAPTPAAPIANVRELTPRERVEQLNADDVARCLQACSHATAAQLLRAGNWPWKAQVLGLIPEPRRARVLDNVRRESPTLPPAVLSLLCERLLQQAAQLKTIRSQPAASAPIRGCVAAWRPGRHSTLRARFRRFIRWTR